MVEEIDSMNKIILVGPYPPPYGGVSVFVYLLHKFLLKKGVGCELKVIRQRSSTEEEHVVPKVTSIYRHFHVLTKKDVCVDSGSLFLEYRSGLAAYAWLLIKSIKKFRWLKIIHDSSFPDRYEKFQLGQKLLTRYLMHQVDEFIVVSDGLYDWLKHSIRVKQKIHLIRSLLPQPDDERASLTGEIEQVLTRHSKLVCSIGTFSKEYGFHQIAEAVEMVRRDSGRDIGLLLIDGGFILEDVSEYKNKVMRNREWISTFESIPHQQVLGILKRCDVFVRGVALESYGISRVESILCGTPVIATSVGETRGMLLYEYGDVSTLIKNLKQVLFQECPDKTSFWADHFKREAEANLRSLVDVIACA